MSGVMKVRMTTTRYGSPDGFLVVLYSVGEVYEVGSGLDQIPPRILSDWMRAGFVRPTRGTDDL